MKNGCKVSELDYAIDILKDLVKHELNMLKYKYY